MIVSTPAPAPAPAAEAAPHARDSTPAPHALVSTPAPAPTCASAPVWALTPSPDSVFASTSASASAPAGV